MNYPLNEEGISQSKKLGEYLKEIKFDEVFTSPLKRARQTAENFIGPNIYKEQAKFSESDLLLERNIGDFEGVPHLTFFNTEYFKDRFKRPPKGESNEDVFKRVEIFLKDLITKYVNKNWEFKIDYDNFDKNYKNINLEEFNENLLKNRYNSDSSEKIEINTRIGIVTHSAVLKEFVNYLIILNFKEYSNFIAWKNTGYYVIDIFCPICNGKCLDNNHHDNVSMSIRKVNDLSHLNN